MIRFKVITYNEKLIKIIWKSNKFYNYFTMLSITIASKIKRNHTMHADFDLSEYIIYSQKDLMFVFQSITHKQQDVEGKTNKKILIELIGYDLDNISIEKRKTL